MCSQFSNGVILKPRNNEYYIQPRNIGIFVRKNFRRKNHGIFIVNFPCCGFDGIFLMEFGRKKDELKPLKWMSVELWSTWVGGIWIMEMAAEQSIHLSMSQSFTCSQQWKRRIDILLLRRLPRNLLFTQTSIPAHILLHMLRCLSNSGGWNIITSDIIIFVVMLKMTRRFVILWLVLVYAKLPHLHRR